mmetsp:Transcript_13667/g.22927  ORF Transcript_13667/g.22927 Transcript_13667/m.22927 type:complete len:86 (-) Transcript_13667:645-902(-)
MPETIFYSAAAHRCRKQSAYQDFSIFQSPPHTREETIKKAKIYIVLALRIHGNACGDTRQSCTRRQIVAAYDVAQTNETTNKTVI